MTHSQNSYSIPRDRGEGLKLEVGAIRRIVTANHIMIEVSTVTLKTEAVYKEYIHYYVHV